MPCAVVGGQLLRSGSLRPWGLPHSASLVVGTTALLPDQIIGVIGRRPGALSESRTTDYARPG
jgi:hypothetical protein